MFIKASSALEAENIFLNFFDRRPYLGVININSIQIFEIDSKEYYGLKKNNYYKFLN